MIPSPSLQALKRFHLTRMAIGLTTSPFTIVAIAEEPSVIKHILESGSTMTYFYCEDIRLSREMF